MLRIHTDPAVFTAETGFPLPEGFITTGLNLDGWPTVQPLLVETGQGRYLLAKEIDRGYVASGSLPASIQPLFYAPYWHVARIGQRRPEPPTPVAALQQIGAGDCDVAVDAHLSLTHYHNIARAFRVHLPEAGPAPGYSTYRVPRQAVLERNARGRARAVETAGMLARELGITDKLASLWACEDDRFPTLDLLMAATGLEWVLAAAPLDVQELTGTPALGGDRGLLAAYQRGADAAWIIAPEGVAPDAGWQPQALDLAALTARPATVAVQIDYLTIGRARQYGLPLDGWASAMGLLRRWRELRTCLDLPYYMIAIHATRNGVEGSLAMARRELAAGRPVTEADLERSHFRLVGETLAQLGLGHTFQPYWTSIHSATRSLTPAPATAQPLGPQINCLRWDCGIKLYDENGMLRAVSDLARNLTWKPEEAALREKLDRIMVEQIIPSCRPGCTGRDVYMVAVRALEPILPEFRAAGLLPPFSGAFHENFTRDVGHVFGKEEPVTFAFAYDQNEQKLQAGMVVAIEWQWFIGATNLACEDILVVTPQGGVNITRPV